METMTVPLPRPGPQDAAPYYFQYIDLVPAGDVLEILAGGLAETRRVLRELGPEREMYRYAPGKWTVRDLVGHILDTERVFGYRAFHIARGDMASLPSMDQEGFAATARAERRPLADLLDELDLVRRSHVWMFHSFDRETWERAGLAAGVNFRVRSFPYVMAGHEIHHRSVLVERYLTR
jgi:hypothetical protein